MYFDNKSKEFCLKMKIVQTQNHRRVMARRNDEAICLKLAIRSIATDCHGLCPRNDVADWAVFLFFYPLGRLERLCGVRR
jgi:hypothetical protein